jgi:hypothetical protein
MMKDFLGNEYGEGDLVIYGASSGRCINMVIGRVVSIKQRARISNGSGYKNELLVDRDGNPVYTVRVQPLHSSRWSQHDPRTYYVDTRTGKKVDRHEHVKIPAHWTLNSTGRRLPDNCSEWYLYKMEPYGVGNGMGSRARSNENPDYVAQELRTYSQTVFEDYIEEHEEGPKPVSITVTENIVKWLGELPDVS